jgi:hypothetical protein
MASRRVWIANTTTYPLWLTCGHTTHGNGRPTVSTHQPPHVGDEWDCDLCAVYIMAQRDQNGALMAELVDRVTH